MTAEDDNRNLVPIIKALLPAMMAEAAKTRREYPTDSESIEQAVIRLGATYALILLGGKLRIMRECLDPFGRPDMEFLTVEAFTTWEGVDRYSAGKAQRVGIGQLFLTHAARRAYAGFRFAPEGAPADVLNLWKGFAVTPSDADIEKIAPVFMDHLRTNIAGGQEDRFRYIWRWSSHMVQRPTERPGIALVLRGGEGVGKTVFGETLGSLLGVHYTLIDDPRYLVGQFNSFMARTLLLQCDEGFWAGDKGSEGRLKGLITSSIQMIEAKGLDAVPQRNLVRLLVTSNERWVIPAGSGARRFAVFDVGDHAKGNAEYFGEIKREMDNGGREALLGALLKTDLAGIDLRAIPETEALAEQKLLTMHPEVLWLLEVLRRGAPLKRMDGWAEEVPCDDWYSDYSIFAERMGIRRRASPEQLGILIGGYVPPASGYERRRVRRSVVIDLPDGKQQWVNRRMYVYKLPSLDEWRGFFIEQHRLREGYFDTVEEFSDQPD